MATTKKLTVQKRLDCLESSASRSYQDLDSRLRNVEYRWRKEDDRRKTLSCILNGAAVFIVAILAIIGTSTLVCLIFGIAIP